MDVESLFAAALQRSTIADREAFLDQACAGDVALLRRGGRLIAVHEKSLGPLDRPAGPPDPTEAAEEPPRAEASQGGRVGTTVAGRYRLLREIGEGGMGTVYLAEQVQPVRRRVALKLIKAGMGSRAVLARFDAERQALALMDHTNIAKVHDGGTTEGGHPFFLKEDAEGVPITEPSDTPPAPLTGPTAVPLPGCPG